MSRLRTLLRLLAALLCFGAALAIVLDAGLPQRADYSGGLRGRRPLSAPQVGYLAPDFALRTPANSLVSLANHNSDFTLIYFWATSCPPCRRDMRELSDLRESLPTLRILAVNMGESAAAVRDWVRALDLRYYVLLDPSLRVARLYQIRGLPTLFLLNGGGRILRLYYASASAGQLRRDIARYAGRG